MQRKQFAVVLALGVSSSAHAQQPERWRLVEEWRVGGAVSGPHSLLDVRAVRVLSDGRLVVLDRHDQQIHILSPRGGRPLTTLGKRGAGPGEFSGISGITIGPRDQIVVNDHQAARLTFFSPDGSLITTRPHPRTGSGLIWTAWFTPEGRLEELGSQTTVLNGQRHIGELRITWSADYSRADTIRAATCPATEAARLDIESYRVAYDQGPGTMSWPYPFQLGPFGKLHTARGVWISRDAEHRTIDLLQFGTCDAVARIDLGGAPIAVPPRVLTEIRSALRAQQRPGDPETPDPDRVRTALPFFAGLATDPQGRLWVDRYVAGTVRFERNGASGIHDAHGDSQFDVYSERGALIATVTLPHDVRTPRNGRPFVITDRHVYATLLDDNDLPYLVSLRIERTPPAP